MYPELKDYFKYDSPFTTNDLYEFYKKFGEDVNPNTLRWRIYKLKEKGVISSIKRGVYILEEKSTFPYIISKDMKKKFNFVNKRVNYTNMCIWTTLCLHNFMNHQPMTNITIFEVDRDMINVVFQILKEKFNNIYLNPDANQIEDYILNDNAVVIRPLLKDSPIIKKENIKTPKIEKILVDLFFDNTLLVSYKGYEMINIFDNIFQMYSVNLTTLYNYSKKRGIYNKIKDFLMYDTHINKKYL